MNLSLTELEAVVQELERDLVLGQIQELRQPSTTAIWLAVRGAGRTVNVFLETARERARIHAVEARSTTLNPPPAFVSYLRAHLENARVVAVDMPWPDRVVVIRCQRGDAQRALVLECSGHHANLFITDWEGKIQMALKYSDSKRRELVHGTTYQPPFPGPKREKTVDRIAQGLSPSVALAAHFATLDADDALDLGRRERAQALRRELRRVERALAGVRRDLARAVEWESHERQGELLKANYNLLRPGMTTVEVVDYWDPEQRVLTVGLDPARSPQANIERCFQRARKGKRGAGVAAARERELAASADQLSALLETVEGAVDLVALEAMDEQLQGFSPRLRKALELKGSGGRRRAQSGPRLPYREYTAQSGRAIRVGRGDRDNHSLTFQHTAPHDVWLHVRGFSGSHVVLPLSRGQAPDKESLLDAAYLAIHYSRAPDEGFNEVMWTRRKYVSAVKKGAPGQVIVQQEKNLAVQADPVRLAALLRRRER